MNRRLFIDMDGTLAEWKENESTDILYEKGYYEKLKPNEFLLQVIKELVKKGEDIYILSSFLNDSKYALEEKNNWLDRYLPELSKNKRIFIKYGDNKALSVPNGVSKFDYLIDDYTKNLFDWNDAGGVAIKFLNGINNNSKQWQGLNVKSNASLYEDLMFILEYPEKSQDEFNKHFIECSRDLTNAINFYKKMVNSSDIDFLNAELKVKDAKNKYYEEKKRLQNLYNIEILNSWRDEDKVGLHYKISFKDGRKLYEGYDYFNLENQMITDELLIEKVIGFNVRNKTDIVKISPELKDLVKKVLSFDNNESIRLYADDLLDSWNINYNQLFEKIDNIESELSNIGIQDYIEFNIIDTYPKTLEYIDIKPEIISCFEFSNEGKENKKFNFNVNGKEVVCELEFDEKMGGVSVSGYTIDNNQTLTKEELSIIQAKLFNEVNEIYNEIYLKNNEEIDADFDITDEMF